MQLALEIVGQRERLETAGFLDDASDVLGRGLFALRRERLGIVGNEVLVDPCGAITSHPEPPQLLVDARQEGPSVVDRGGRARPRRRRGRGCRDGRRRRNDRSRAVLRATACAGHGDNEVTEERGEEGGASKVHGRISLSWIWSRFSGLRHRGRPGAEGCGKRATPVQLAMGRGPRLARPVLSSLRALASGGGGSIGLRR